MADAVKNFAYTTVATAPSPATSGTSLVVASGTGALFPTAPFNLTIWPVSAQPTTSNAEIVRVTAISTDTLTITRAQEGTTARTVIVGDQIALTVTAKTMTDRVAQATSISSGYASAGGWLLLNQTYFSSGSDPEPLMVYGFRSSAQRRAFWLNENGSPRGASVNDEPALKLFGPEAPAGGVGTYAGMLIDTFQSYTTQTHRWGIDYLGRPVFGTGSSVGANVISLPTATALPSGLPAGTVVVRY